jgi:hypothetical protein
VLDLKIDQPFDFHSLLVSHGWVDLLPNIYQRESETFSRIEELHSGKIVRLDITEADHTVKAAIQHTSRLSSADLKDVEQRVRHMLRLDEDFSEFYEICSHSGKPWSEMASGKGRLLRSAGLFEDMVKVILRTNVQWGGTRRMVAEIVNAFGKPLPQQPELKAFPRPEAIAANTFEGFQSQVGWATAHPIFSNWLRIFVKRRLHSMLTGMLSAARKKCARACWELRASGITRLLPF